MKICKLCKQQKVLIKKSHIIPDFMYKGMFDENHKLVVQPFRQGTIEKWQIRNPSDGEYEGGLLCDECDNRLLGHYYEDYASRIYSGEFKANENPIFTNCINQHGIGFIKCEQLNYHKYKLFLLSILWRASISTRAFFEEVRLEHSHEEEIRRMIFEKDAGEVSKYPIFICSYAENPTFPKDLIAQPRLINATEDLHVYSFLIKGYFYTFYVNKPSAIIPEYVTAETIKPNNELSLIMLPEDKVPTFVLGQFGLDVKAI